MGTRSSGENRFVASWALRAKAMIIARLGLWLVAMTALCPPASARCSFNDLQNIVEAQTVDDILDFASNLWDTITGENGLDKCLDALVNDIDKFIALTPDKIKKISANSLKKLQVADWDKILG